LSVAFGYPVNLDVRDRRCLIVGGGSEARARAAALAELGARVVVSDTHHELTGELGSHPGVELHVGPFDAALLDGAFLVIAASDDRAERRRVATLARETGHLVNAVDENDLCDWAAPAILRRGGLTVALGTGGVAPALAVRLRDRLADWLGPEIGTLLELLADVRPRIMASGRPFAQRRWLWYELVDGEALEHCRAGRVDRARAVIGAAIDDWEAAA
jgi:siroheme synthase-like protein